ncbi:MAG: hypothetical protein M3O99_02670 [Chloroflexota bacterium]|nr:hypothetical protein [Chloroflexota bacterium]
MNSNLVRFICRATVHVDASRNPTEAAGSPVTIHDGGWAYCPGGAQTEHEWEAIEPVSLTDLKLIAVGRPREAAPEDSRT